MDPNDENDDQPGGSTFEGRAHEWLFEPDAWARYTRYHFLVAKFVFFGAIAYILYWCLSLLGDVLFPVFVSLVVAYLFDPLIDWFEDRNIPRTVGILFTILAGLALGTLFALILYPTIVQQVRSVIDGFPKLLELIETRTIPWVERNFHYEVPGTVDQGLEKYGQSVGQYLPNIAEQVGSWARGIVLGTGAIVAAVINIVAIPVFSFYFLRDFDRIQSKVAEFIPEHRRDVVLARAREMDEVVGEWVRGQLQVASILAVMYAIGLIFPFQACGLEVRSAVAVGVLTGMLNFIPYFGVAVGTVLSTLMVVINWSGFGPIVGTIGVFVVVQTFEGYLITPRIVGEKVGLSPVTVIIVLLIGGELYGLLGVLLAVPVFGALKVLFPDLVAYYKNTPFFTGEFEVGEREGPADSPPDGEEGGSTNREGDASTDGDDSSEG